MKKSLEAVGNAGDFVSPRQGTKDQQADDRSRLPEPLEQGSESDAMPEGVGTDEGHHGGEEAENCSCGLGNHGGKDAAVGCMAKGGGHATGRARQACPG